jgi:hypothetical protein
MDSVFFADTPHYLVDSTSPHLSTTRSFYPLGEEEAAP